MSKVASPQPGKWMCLRLFKVEDRFLFFFLSGPCQKSISQVQTFPIMHSHRGTQHRLTSLSDFASFLPNPFGEGLCPPGPTCSGQAFSSGPDRGRHWLLCQVRMKSHPLCSRCPCLLLNSCTGLLRVFWVSLFPQSSSPEGGDFAFAGSVRLPYPTLSFPERLCPQAKRRAALTGKLFPQPDAQNKSLQLSGVHLLPVK